MAHCSPGDRVVCHIANGAILSVYSDEWEYKHIFEIIALYDGDYMVYIPSSIFIKRPINITASNHKKYNIDKKFIDSEVCQISNDKIVSIYARADGMQCDICKDFYPMAEPNQPDGGLVCWSCTHYKIYKSRLT
jgi:hypothetical protein